LHIRKEKLSIYFHLLLFHRYKRKSPVPFRGYDEIKSVKSQKTGRFFFKLNFVKMYGTITGFFGVNMLDTMYLSFF